MEKNFNSYFEKQATREENLFNYFSKRVLEIQEEIEHTPFFMINKRNILKDELDFFKKYEEKHFKNYIDICNNLK